MIYYSVHYNRPDFISIQNKFLNAPLVVINNSNNESITKECDKLNIKCFNIENNASNPSESHAFGLNFLKTIIDYNEDYCIIDHDLFPYKEIVFNDDIKIIGHKIESNPKFPYLWAGLIACKKEINLNCINFMPSLIPSGDTACDTHKLVKQYKNQIHFCKETRIGEKINNFYQTSPIISQFDDFCFHYLNGSEWMKCEKSIKSQKNDLLIKLLTSKQK